MEVEIEVTPVIEFDGTEDQTVHRTAHSAMEDEADTKDETLLCGRCGGAFSPGAPPVRLVQKDGYEEVVFYAHMSCIRKAVDDGKN